MTTKKRCSQLLFLIAVLVWVGIMHYVQGHVPPLHDNPLPHTTTYPSPDTSFSSDPLPLTGMPDKAYRP